MRVTDTKRPSLTDTRAHSLYQDETGCRSLTIMLCLLHMHLHLCLYRALCCYARQVGIPQISIVF